MIEENFDRDCYITKQRIQQNDFLHYFIRRPS